MANLKSTQNDEFSPNPPPYQPTDPSGVGSNQTTVRGVPVRMDYVRSKRGKQ